MYFNGCQDIETARKQYRRLSAQYHPDMGGDAEKMKAVNGEWDALKRYFALYGRMPEQPSMGAVDDAPQAHEPKQRKQRRKQKRTIYTETAILDFISLFRSKGGEIYILEHGTNGFGKVVMTGKGLATFVIKETVSRDTGEIAYLLRRYQDCPKKYRI